MSGLPEELREWVAAVTGGAVTAAWASGGGRPGFGIDVLVDGQTRGLYLQRGRPQPHYERMDAIRRHVRRIREDLR